MLSKIVADNILIFFYHYFSEKIKLGISCDSSAKQTRNMKPYFAVWAITSFNQSITETQSWAKSLGPDHMPQNVTCDQNLHCLPHIQQFSDKEHSKMDLFKDNFNPFHAK